MDWKRGRPNFPMGFSGTFASSRPSRRRMNWLMPLSKSAWADQVSSIPFSVAETFTSVGAGGGVVSETAPVLVYSIQALAMDSLGRQLASVGLPWNFAAGTASPALKE